MLVYHGSQTAGISTVIPRVSPHGRPVVYASDRMDSVFLYCAKWNDFMLTCGSDDVVVERYQGAFDELYKDKSGYTYLLDAAAFHFDESCQELISEQPVDVIDCIAVNRLYDVIMKRYRVYLYPDKPAWLADDDRDIVEHAVKIYHMCGDPGVFEYVRTKFPKLGQQIDSAVLWAFR